MVGDEGGFGKDEFGLVRKLGWWLGFYRSGLHSSKEWFMRWHASRWLAAVCGSYAPAMVIFDGLVLFSLLYFFEFFFCF